MKLSPLALGFIGALLLCATAPARASDSHHHHHDHEAAPARLELDQGKKWPTDEPLRQAMTTLRSAFAARLADIHAGRLNNAQYAALGQTIDSQIAQMVSQCKLEPKADAMLHIVIADLAAAADVMQGRTQGQPAAAAHRAATALNDYGRHFNHPRWAELK